MKMGTKLTKNAILADRSPGNIFYDQNTDTLHHLDVIYLRKLILMTDSLLTTFRKVMVLERNDMDGLASAKRRTYANTIFDSLHKGLLSVLQEYGVPFDQAALTQILQDQLS